MLNPNFSKPFLNKGFIEGIITSFGNNTRNFFLRINIVVFCVGIKGGDKLYTFLHRALKTTVI